MRADTATLPKGVIVLKAIRHHEPKVRTVTISIPFVVC
jgi:hypothetical protein